jgi:uncharacterized membrane protein YfcA
MEVLAAIVTGVVVGLSLGLTGGGGSILAVPMLVYAVGLAPAAAVPVSLAAVALTALVGTLHAARSRLPVWPAAGAFAAGGAIAAPLGIALAARLDERLLLLCFAGLALVVGALMAWRSVRRPEEAAAVRALPAPVDGGGACRLADDGRLRFTAPCAAVLGAAGLGTGLLSGLFGVGGGFVIVPVLMGVTQMGVHRAVATSLVVLVAIGLAGAVAALLRGVLPWDVLLPFVAGGGAGMVAGRMLAARLAGPLLQRLFAAAIVAVALLMGYRGLMA